MASKAKDKDVNEEGSENTMKEKGESARQETESARQETVNEEYNVPANVEGFIELRGLSDSYDEIEFLGEEYNVPEDAEDSDVIVLDTQWTRSYDDDSSGDESYMGQSSSSDVEESLSDDFGSEEFNVEAESDGDEDGLGSENDDVSLKQLCVLPEAERSGTMPSFIVGMTFEDKKELKRAVDEYAVSRGVKLRTVRSDRKTFRVVCQDGCPFMLYASTHGQSVGWQVKSLDNEHMCARVFVNPRASTKWLARYFKNKVQEDPKFKTKEMKKGVQRDLKVNVSVFKCKRAKKIIMDEMEGSFRDEFANLEPYCNELRVTNPGSDVFVEVSQEGLEHGRRIFKRMYVCFNTSKVGWNQGCRPLIGVDGTFLKGKCRGVLLTAVGVDGNDSLYPLAIGLVEKENGHQWSWFLQWLQRSLNLGGGENVTLMSDMQKGLVNAVSEVLPAAEHRFCARHIYANWSKKWRGNEFKKKFFSCAWSTYEEDFKDNLSRLGSLRKEAATDAVTYNIHCWVRAYFSSRCKSWAVDNNMSESFNAWIDEYRFLPVIRMVDGIRLKMMDKWADSERNVRGWKTDYSPKCMELFECNRFLAEDCRVCFNGDEGYEVVEDQDRHIVNISRGMCTCRAWDLTGIPCQHAICAMYHGKVDPKIHISHYYHKDTYIAAYSTKLQPVRGRKFWDTTNYGPLQPPPVANLPGRPPQKRTRTDEADRRRKKSRSHSQRSERSATSMPQQGGIDRLSRSGKIHKCRGCNKPGHNISSCKEQHVKETRASRRCTQQPPNPTQDSQQQSQSHFLASQQPPQPTQEEPNRTQGFQPPPSHPQPSSTTRRPTRHARGGYGFGIRFDESTGRSVYNPGQNSEYVIEEGTLNDYMSRNADPQTQFPIPNEREMRLSGGSKSTERTGSRCIQFRSQSIPFPPTSDIPFQSRGLQWRGEPCITSSQLLSRIQTEKDKGKKAIN